MNWAREWRPLLVIVGGFLAFYLLPVGNPRFDNALLEGLHLARWYAQEHVLLCLVPAFFIAGAIGVFVSQTSVMKYLGANARKVTAYGVASVSGTVLAVCSCTVLPLFAGIYRMGAGLGPASTFLYAGPAITVLAIILSARILGIEMGIARALGATSFGVFIGLAMHLLFRGEERTRAANQAAVEEAAGTRSLGQEAVYFGSMVGILVFANWGQPQADSGFWQMVHAAKWELTALFGIVLALVLRAWFGLGWARLAVAVVPAAVLAWWFPASPAIAFTAAVVGLSAATSTAGGELGEWFSASWEFAKLILPLLVVGVLLAGVLLGRPGHEGLIPSAWISALVGGNSLRANLFASVVGAFMYFATLTEVPIVQGLIGSGMGKGPALALLLAGPALSLPSMLVIHGILGTKKTFAFVVLVVVMATASGVIYGSLFG
ncbi:MAG TPA: permease [Vicinamibacterales bacterium]|nr:permease [Vicinamibacterales bacterium]